MEQEEQKHTEVSEVDKGFLQKKCFWLHFSITRNNRVVCINISTPSVFLHKFKYHILKFTAHICGAGQYMLKIQ